MSVLCLHCLFGCRRLEQNRRLYYVSLNSYRQVLLVFPYFIDLAIKHAVQGSRPQLVELLLLDQVVNLQERPLELVEVLLKCIITDKGLKPILSVTQLLL